MRDVVNDLKQKNKSLDSDLVSDINIIFGNLNSRNNIMHEELMAEIQSANCMIH